MARQGYLEGTCSNCKRKMFRKVSIDEKNPSLPRLCHRCSKKDETP